MKMRNVWKTKEEPLYTFWTILSDRRSKKKKSRIMLCVIDVTYSPFWRKKYCARCNNTMYTGYATKEKNTSQSLEGGVWFLRLALHNHVFCFFCCCFLFTQRRSSSWRRSVQWRESFCMVLHAVYANARVWCCVCGTCVAMKSLTWRKKHLSRHPFSSMSETLYRNCTLLLLSICTHLHTYVHTYTHMHWTTVFFFEGEHN